MLILRAHYNYSARLRAIPGASFNYDLKAWVCPVESLPLVKAYFPGEIYFKTPENKITGLVTTPELHPRLSYGDLYDLPTLAHATPFPYQEDGAKFMISRLDQYGFCLNSDAVGLGKTLQTILTIRYYMAHKQAKKVIVICKKSLKTQWRDEIYKFTGETEDTLPIYVTQDTKKKREKAYQAAKDAESCVLITNYQNFLNDGEMISAIKFDICAIDEAHELKTPDGKMHIAIRKFLCGEAVGSHTPTILLTGTPLMSKPQDVFGVIELGTDRYFGTYKEFADRYLVTTFSIYGEQVIGAHHLDELREKIAEVMIRRTADDIEIELPTVLPPIDRICPLDGVQKKMLAYIKEEKEALDAEKAEVLDRGKTARGEIREEAKAKIEEINQKSKMYLAAQQFVADDPRLFLQNESKVRALKVIKGMVPAKYVMSAKQEATLDLIKEIVDSGEKVIVFCHFATPAFLLKQDLEKLFGIKAVMYTGRESDKQREESIRCFKTLEEYPVLIGTEAMAEGLNLQVCSYMIHYEQADTFAKREQRIGRIRRPGSKAKYLRVYDMYTEQSFDLVKKHKLLRDKELSAALLD